jgi:uncharacterized protein (TIGR03435 family)
MNRGQLSSLTAWNIPLRIDREQTRAGASPFLMRKCGVALTIVALASSARAQFPAFETVSVRLHKPAGAVEGGNRESIDSVPGRLTIRNASLSTCIKWAYIVTDYQISAPAWLQIEKYDIVAKALGPAPLPQLRQMLQTLLADRFHLQLHRETKDLPVYELIAAKSGPKLHKADPGGNTDMRGENGSFAFHSTSMPQFAEDLSTLSQVDRPVLDRTGLPGIFDFSLKFGDSSADLKRALVEGDGPSIFTVIQEQLGLKLEARKGPIEMLVIDRVERVPTEN